MRLPPESKSSGDREAKLLEVGNHFVTVKLLQAVKIPACRSKLVHAKAVNSEVKHPVFFKEKSDNNLSKIIINIYKCTCKCRKQIVYSF